MLTIRTLGDKVLTQKAKRVASVDDTIRNLCTSMIDVMIKNNGIGLAANQVGILKRIIIVSDEGNIRVMINPEIVEFSENTCMMEEGCLSIPETYLPISRAENIKVKYRDLKGKPHFETYSGLTARIIQHEIDHLDGITMDTLETVPAVV
jgi:peptide deformylase